MAALSQNWLFQKLRFPIDTDGKDRVLFDVTDALKVTRLKQEIKFTNNGMDCYAFKIACTSNEKMGVTPAKGALKPSESLMIKFTHVSSSLPQSGQHWFGVQLFKSADETIDELCEKNTIPDFNRRFYVEFDGESREMLSEEDKSSTSDEIEKESASASG